MNGGGIDKIPDYKTGWYSDKYKNEKFLIFK